MITVEELIIQSLYHRMVVVNVRRTPSAVAPTGPGGRVDALGVLISGAQRMRSAMGAQGQLPEGQPAGEPLPGTSSSCSSSRDGDLDASDVTGSCVMQIKSRQNTIDFSDEVQTILDTGEIKLVKAMQKSTETQTEFTPVWFFGFDPSARQDARDATDAGVTGSGVTGSEVQGSEPSGVRDIPAVDLSKFEQFSVVHYSDTRDPENRSLVMIQTPGSKMYKPAELSGDQISVSERPGLEGHNRVKRQIFGKSKSLDNSAIPMRTNSSSSPRLNGQGKTDSREVVEEVHEGDSSLRDPDIDSGIWDVVQGRESRLSSRDPPTPAPQQSTSTSLLEEMSGDQKVEPEESGEEDVSWQDMYNQLAAQSGGDRPTMSYRMFHVQDQVMDSTNKPEAVILESSMPVGIVPHKPCPVGSSTPRLQIHRTDQEEQTADSTLSLEKDSDSVSEVKSDDSILEDVFPDESVALGEAAEGRTVEEDSGWLFDKVAALQGSLVHTPTSPGSPRTLRKTVAHSDGDSDVTPTEAADEEVIVVETTEQSQDAIDELPVLHIEEETSPWLADVARSESTSTLDTVIRTEAEVSESWRSQEDGTRGALYESENSGDWDHSQPVSPSHVCIDYKHHVSYGLSEEEEEHTSEVEDTEEEMAGEFLGDSDPVLGHSEDVSVLEASQATSNSNGDIYESCDEGPILDEETVLIKSASSDLVDIDDGEVASTNIFSAVRTLPYQSSRVVQSSLQSKGPFSRPVTMGPSQGSCVVHRSGARPKMPPRSAKRRSQVFGLQNILLEDTGTMINGHSEGQPSHGKDSQVSDDVYVLNKDGTLSNTNTGVVYRSGARPRGGPVPGQRGWSDSGLQGLNSLMMKSTSSTVVHSHVVTELTAARARLHVPELRRTPDRHSVASSDSEYASVDSSLATSPTSTSVEELASVGSDTCLLSEVMPVASYADWMAHLPKRLHAVPLTQLAMPGSNVSFAIESDMRTDMSFSKCNLEMAEFLRKLPPLAVFDNFRKIMKDIWRAWMPKQILSITKQLEAGVRYLDVRITRYRGTFYGEHGLYTRHLKHYMKQVEEFIQAHPKEVIILHFQKFTNLTPKDKRSLVTLLFQFFGAKLCRVMDISNITLEEMWASRKQIIAIFPDSDMPALSNHIFAGLIWSSKNIRSSLPRKQTTQELVTYLESVYDEEREEAEFHVLQAVVSPDMNMVFGDYEHKSMRSMTLYETSPYLKVWLPGKFKLNIVTVDFVGIYDLTGEIIRLNEGKKAETVV